VNGVKKVFHKSNGRYLWFFGSYNISIRVNNNEACASPLIEKGNTEDIFQLEPISDDELMDFDKTLGDDDEELIAMQENTEEKLSLLTILRHFATYTNQKQSFDIFIRITEILQTSSKL
jgi:hypothetical protein